MSKIKTIIKRTVLSLFALAAATVIAGIGIGCCSFSGTKYMGRVSDHFDGEKFHNQEQTGEKGFSDLFKWMTHREPGQWPEQLNEEQGPAPQARVRSDSLVVTFINHSTVLIQVDGLNILTDPVWSERVSPVSFIGPVRHRKPGLKFSDLPPIDLVIVSHNHYDHMDLPTLEMLDRKFKPMFLVPLGNKELLNKYEINNVKEMDWWDSDSSKGIQIYFVPSRHFSGRGLCDRNKTLWGGYVILTSGGPVYFAGDTGFGKHFKQIFDKFGPIRLSMLPVGAYRPRWFMKPIHVNPDEAVQAHIILHSQTSMAIHWGTFRQADDGMYEPIDDLKISLAKHNLTENDFLVLKHGIGKNIEALKK
ncbi:MAG: MBL fold metallo-hydrolase [FCB group bacterium]|jgi:L-ascorbate metabolism protein UlaG (beta-lactamase superfamily)